MYYLRDTMHSDVENMSLSASYTRFVRPAPPGMLVFMSEYHLVWNVWVLYDPSINA
jgi:hypothetical protein